MRHAPVINVARDAIGRHYIYLRGCSKFVSLIHSGLPATRWPFMVAIRLVTSLTYTTKHAHISNWRVVRLVMSQRLLRPNLCLNFKFAYLILASRSLREAGADRMKPELCCISLLGLTWITRDLGMQNRPWLMLHSLIITLKSCRPKFNVIWAAE